MGQVRVGPTQIAERARLPSGAPSLSQGTCGKVRITPRPRWGRRSLRICQQQQQKKTYAAAPPHRIVLFLLACARARACRCRFVLPFQDQDLNTRANRTRPSPAQLTSGCPTANTTTQDIRNSNASKSATRILRVRALCTGEARHTAKCGPRQPDRRGMREHSFVPKVLAKIQVTASEHLFTAPTLEEVLCPWAKP